MRARSSATARRAAAVALTLGVRGTLLGGLGLRGALAQGDSRPSQAIANMTGRKTKSPERDWGRCATMIAALPRTIASPTRA